jgi:catechol 1,2-dioxygenase
LERCINNNLDSVGRWRGSVAREGCRRLLLVFAAFLLAASFPAASTAGECTATETNVEGPYYLPAAPFRENIAPGVQKGVRLEISGRVYAADCRTPLEGAVVEVWQTGARGRYDFSKRQLYRGRVKTDSEGRYRFETVFPGRYRTGLTYRPAHIHLRVGHPAWRTLVTQIYFEDDPYLERDPFVRPSLIIPLEPLEGEATPLSGIFDIVLERR